MIKRDPEALVEKPASRAAIRPTQEPVSELAAAGHNDIVDFIRFEVASFSQRLSTVDSAFADALPTGRAVYPPHGVRAASIIQASLISSSPFTTDRRFCCIENGESRLEPDRILVLRDKSQPRNGYTGSPIVPLSIRAAQFGPGDD